VTRQHGDADFSSFEGFELLGMPTLVMQRGQVIIEHDQVVGSPGLGHFLSSDVNRAAYAPDGPPTA
jgi:dihydropyrimidinase